MWTNISIASRNIAQIVSAVFLSLRRANNALLDLDSRRH
jgi:hypothetical protein